MPTPSNQQSSHAGGIVYRRASGRREYLLVRARKEPDRWVFPKGHIEAGEAPETAALREVLEEAGVRARIVARLGRVMFGADGVEMFLMAYAGEGAVPERERAWLARDAAMRELGFAESRALLSHADQVADGRP